MKTSFLYLKKRLKSNLFPIRKLLEANQLKSNKKRLLTSLKMILIHIKQQTSNITFNNRPAKVVVACLVMIFLVWISQILLLLNKFQNLLHKIHHKVKGEKWAKLQESMMWRATLHHKRNRKLTGTKPIFVMKARSMHGLAETALKIMWEYFCVL